MLTDLAALQSVHRGMNVHVNKTIPMSELTRCRPTYVTWYITRVDNQEQSRYSDRHHFQILQDIQQSQHH